MNAEVDRMVSVLLTLVKNTQLSAYWSPLDERHLRTSARAEGLPFLTVTLPRLGKALESALRTGVLLPVEGFACVKNQAYPSFMRKAWETLFEVRSEHTKERSNTLAFELANHMDSPFMLGDLAHNYAGAVIAIRQVSLMYYKTKLPDWTQDQKDAVETAFLAAEDAISSLNLGKEATSSPDYELALYTAKNESTGVNEEHFVDIDSLLTRAGHLVSTLLHGFSPMDIVPQHGSGASACGVPPQDRYDRMRDIPRLCAVYPYREWFVHNYGVDHSEDELLGDFDNFEDPQLYLGEPLAKAVLVPKDSRGPRLISEEPREFMFIQQGLMAQLYRAIGRYPLVKAQLDCRDQTRNQRLARWGSHSGAVATLDLKDASDRISLTLVERLFPVDWVESLKASRTLGTELPSGRTVLFRKFAPMGSACCFPIMAISIWALINAAMDETGFMSRDLFRSEPHHCDSNQVAVYGDDIIIPRRYYDKVVAVLEAVGLAVNQSKSYRTGPFRESCGTDWFLGIDVSVTKCRELPYADGPVDVIDRASFRTADWFNRLALMYGTLLVSEPLCQLFTEWYGPVVQTDNISLAPDEFSLGGVPSRGLLLLSHRRTIPDEIRKAQHAWEVSVKRYGKRKARRLSRAGLGPFEAIRLNPNGTGKVQVWVLAECPVTVEIQGDRCHYFRITLKGSGEEDWSSWAVPKRTAYRYSWIDV